MEVAKAESMARFSSDKYNRVPIISAGGLLRLLCFEPYQHVPPHKHTKADEYFYVIKGRAQITVGSEEATVESGFIVRAQAGIVHAWKNQDKRLVLLSVLVPLSS
ncbi:MAG TPA: cupin domain-containing protein [Candidatus Bathyarchaeia archaeon]|nr:cupin domain-containing protein [Candidatus Bathyarchaeia archaeon]